MRIVWDGARNHDADNVENSVEAVVAHISGSFGDLDAGNVEDSVVMMAAGSRIMRYVGRRAGGFKPVGGICFRRCGIAF